MPDYTSRYDRMGTSVEIDYTVRKSLLFLGKVLAFFAGLGIIYYWAIFVWY